MNTFVTVRTFSYPTEVAIIRGRLESEGIECFVQDELTAQVNPLYSNAIGGIKLQVREKDVERAVEILKEDGLLKEEDFEPPKLYSQLDNLTSGIPYINKFRWEVRILILIPAITIIVMCIVYFMSR